MTLAELRAKVRAHNAEHGTTFSVSVVKNYEPSKPKTPGLDGGPYRMGTATGTAEWLSELLDDEWQWCNCEPCRFRWLKDRGLLPKRLPFALAGVPA